MLNGLKPLSRSLRWGMVGGGGGQGQRGDDEREGEGGAGVAGFPAPRLRQGQFARGIAPLEADDIGDPRQRRDDAGPGQPPEDRLAGLHGHDGGADDQPGRDAEDLRQSREETRDDLDLDIRGQLRGAFAGPHQQMHGAWLYARGSKNPSARSPAF